MTPGSLPSRRARLKEDEHSRWWGPAIHGRAHPELGRLIAELSGSSRAEAPVPSARYLLLEDLSSSDAAAVHVAVDALLGRAVVLKIFDRADALIEAQAATLARHPHVVEVYDVAEHEGQGCVVFEYCDGATLFEWSREQPWQAVVGRVLEAGEGLAHCHRHLLVHGDVKPANILVTQGRAVLADFGLAGPPDLIERFGGTAGYIAPELAQGRRSPSADVFSLACTAWMCLFRSRPHAGISPEAMLIAAGDREIAWPASLPDGMPAELLAALTRGLEPDQRRRPSLGDWMAEVELAAAIPARRTQRRSSLRKAVALTLACCSLGAASHAVAVACVDQDGATRGRRAHDNASPATFDDALVLAEQGDPLGAWETYGRLRETYVGPQQGLALASALLEVAESSSGSTRILAAAVGKRIAEDAHARAMTAGNSVLAGELWLLIQGADQILAE